VDVAEPPDDPTGTLCVPERIACSPVNNADRVGVHCDSGQ
jgi:hypothetical protein